MQIEPEFERPRVLLIVFVLLLWMIAVAARLVYLQTFQHDWLKDRAQAQQQGSIKASPLRGLIVDRKGRELARSIEVESLFAVPEEIEDVDATIKTLSTVVNLENKDELVARLQTAKENERKFEWLARKLDHETAEKARALNLKGVHSLKEPKRFYPNKELAADVLGFVNLDEEGIAGVELVQNEKLKGEPTKVFVETDAQRNAYSSNTVSGRAGQTLVLTIDQMVQFYTQQALVAAVERTGAKSGTAIVLNPRTGEILALANTPTFDSNNPRRSSGEAKDNDALQSIYEPGSTFKLVAYSAVIEEGLAHPDERIFCENGAYNIYGRTVKDSHAYGALTLTEALAKSSNIAAIKLGQRLGNKRLYDYIKRFGFGTKTGVELPYETEGLLRPVSKWSRTTIGSIPMGHEIGVTPLQVVSAFAAIANDGVRVSPHLVKEVKTVDENVVYEAKPTETRVVKAETARTIQKMLSSVVTDGTAKRARMGSYTIAGKTGTAQKIDPATRKYSQTKYVASFVGIAPASNPAVVIAVVLDEPRGAHQGGQVAAPVFSEIAEKVLPEMNVASDLREADANANAVAKNSDELYDEDTSGGSLGLEEKTEKEKSNKKSASERAQEKNNLAAKTRARENDKIKQPARSPDARERIVGDKRKAKASN